MSERHYIATQGYRAWDGKRQQLFRMTCACGYAISSTEERSKALMAEHIGRHMAAEDAQEERIANGWNGVGA